MKADTSNSEKTSPELGFTITYQGVEFRLFAPRASQVFLVVFDQYEHLYGTYYSMHKDDEGIWSYIHKGHDLIGKWYAYKLDAEPSPFFEPTDRYIADPWSKWVTSRNHYLGFHKTKIVRMPVFDWEGDDFIAPHDPRDLIIYETHIKDLVAHPSAKTYVQGIYNDFWQAEVGGIQHLKNIGVNAVEFLPLQKFGHFEPPYQEKIYNGITNTLVSPNEADFKANKISIDSPIGKGLLGKKVGEVALVKVPAGSLELEIKKIEI